MNNSSDKKHYTQGELHRIGLPSIDVLWAGCWYFNGKLHRINGNKIFPIYNSREYYQKAHYIYNIILKINIDKLVI